ncbi:unnamed protein product [Sphagnum troendelagicum]
MGATANGRKHALLRCSRSSSRDDGRAPNNTHVSLLLLLQPPPPPPQDTETGNSVNRVTTATISSQVVEIHALRIGRVLSALEVMLQSCM